MVKNPPCQCRRPQFDPWVGKIPCRREWLPTPVFLPGESHGQKSLTGYSPWGCKDSDMTERQALSLSVLLADSLSSFDGARHQAGDTQLHANQSLVGVVLGGLVAQLCLTVCNSMDYTDHGILQARILECVAFPFSKGSSQLRDQSQVSLIAGGFFTD